MHVPPIYLISLTTFDFYFPTKILNSLLKSPPPIINKGKVKVNLSLCLIKHHAMKTYWGSGCIAPRILSTSALDGCERSALRPGRFTPRERVPGTHWIGGWVGPRAGLDAVSKRKIHSPRRESKPDHPIVQPVASRYTDWAIPVHFTPVIGRVRKFP
jgi:hypothetical protein